MQVYKILLPVAVDEPFDYLPSPTPPLREGLNNNSPLPEGGVGGGLLEAGQLVYVPFRSGQELAVVMGTGESTLNPAKLKAVSEVLDLPPLKPELLKFVQFVADYNLAHLGSVLKMVLSAKLIKKEFKPKLATPNPIKPTLSDKQQEIANQITAKVTNQFSATMLDGVTGSGKTEVYFEAIEAALDQGKQALVLLPEIALSHQWLSRFEARFGFEPSIWHSDRTPKQRRDTWLAAMHGNAPVVVGARSALFLPFKNLGLIVVDEEHDASYKQEEGVIYHARDMAVARAAVEKIPAILVSATPSIESINNVSEGKYQLLHLPERFSGTVLPKMQIVDMRAEKLPAAEFVSGKMLDALGKAIAANQQAIIFLNRRGFAPLTLCRACGHRIQCPSCSAWLVMHKATNKLQCHHCGFCSKIPTECPTCHEKDKLAACGPGVERVAEEIAAKMPQARVEVMSSDSPKTAASIVERMLDHKIDVLVGTQMIAKGHHFPHLAFVGIIDADIGLEGGDLRATERTYQLLHQVAGRAGREKDVGLVLIQTYNPQNTVIKSLSTESRDKFVAHEMEARKSFEMPPFGRLATITLSSKNEELVKREGKKLYATAPIAPDVHIFGPAPAPLALLRGQHRHRLLIKAPRKFNVQAYIKQWLAKATLPRSIKVKIDVEPYSFV